MTREFAFPGTRAHYAPDRVVDLQHLTLAVEVDLAERAIRGTATLRCAVIAPATRRLELDAVELAIEKVTVGGKSADYRHDGKRLRIELPKAAEPGSELVIAVDYHG